MNLERTKPETLAAAALDLTPSHFTAAHEYAERLNAALARLGLTDRLTLPPAPNTAIDELPGVVDVPLRKTLSVLMGKAQQGDASALATLEMAVQVMESIFAGLHARDFAGDRPLALPSHESLATLSQGVDALLPRKISNGAWSLLADGTPSDGIQDGMSLVRLLCSDAADSVTELKDENIGWTMTKAVVCFENIIRMKLNCRIAHCPCIACYDQSAGNYNEHLKILELPLLEEMQYYTTYTDNTYMGIIIGTEIEELYLPELHTVRYADDCRNRYDLLYIARGEKLRKVMAPKLSSAINNNASNGPMSQCPMLNTFIAPLYTGVFTRIFKDCPQLIHVEVDFNGSRNLDSWIPTMALRTDTTAEDYVDLREDMSFANNLEQFLSNFKTYIAERLKGGYAVGTGPTLTLSKEVRDAIQKDPQIVEIIVTSKGWTISPAPSV